MGHYHNKRKGKIVRYLGSTQHMTKSDAGTTKSYYTFNLDNEELKAYNITKSIDIPLYKVISSKEELDKAKIDNNIIILDDNFSKNLKEEELDVILSELEKKNPLDLRFASPTYSRKDIAMGVDIPEEVKSPKQFLSTIQNSYVKGKLSDLTEEEQSEVIEVGESILKGADNE